MLPIGQKTRQKAANPRLLARLSTSGDGRLRTPAVPPNGPGFLKKLDTQNGLGNQEVNYQSGGIHEGCNKRIGKHRWVGSKS
jgi:hypothetical protein